MARHSGWQNPLRIGVVAVFLACLVQAAVAQSAGPAGSAPAWWAARQADFAEGNLAQAEHTLLRDNRNAAGTPAWHLESAHRLAEMAFTFRDNHQPAPAVAVANRALAQLTLAEDAYAGDAAHLADAEELAGLICDRLLEDKATAMTHYQNAVQLDTTRAQAAQRLRQLQTRQAALAAKHHS